MNGKREMIKELTNAAVSILSKYENDERNGLLSREEAQKTAIARIQYLRYGDENKDYFWITDMHPVMIVHPYRPDLNGKDLTNFSDPHGKRLFVEFVKTVKKSDHGYVDYMWQWKDDSLHIVPKLSYVQIFKPWNWVIGTGVYIEDVKKEIDALTKRLLWISGAISVIIASMLFIIIQQSLVVERKRIDAENELHLSKEKYRTLVEAATEGLLMLIDGKISFSNPVISKITGFNSAEITNFELKYLLSDNNNSNILEQFSGQLIKEGQYEINLKRRSGGFVSVLATASNVNFYQKDVTILIVKDITIEKDPNLPLLDYKKLLNTLDLGFFRAKIDAKGRFIYANETTCRILGYENFNQLSDTYILQMLASTDDRKSLRHKILQDGFIKTRLIEINKRNNESAYVSVTLVAVDSDNPDELICEGIIEDITNCELEKIKTTNIISSLKSSIFLFEQPVEEYVSKSFSVDADTSIDDALKTIELRKTDCILITKNEIHVIGIVTNSDIQKRVYTLKLNLDNPVYLIMSSPVFYINQQDSVFNAIKTCEEKKCKHLVVKDNSENIKGVFHLEEFYKSFVPSVSFLVHETEKAMSVEELKNIYKKLQLFIKPIIYSELSPKYILNITTTLSDAIHKRVVGLAIDEIGNPPVNFAFVCMGSEGRREETLLTDQDNAIIYENISVEKEDVTRIYFDKLGTRVCNALNEIGYSFCKGNVMAKNPKWCQPISVWEQYFSSWISTPEPQNLLDASIFFDFRHISGNVDITSELKRFIGNHISRNPLFTYHLAFNTNTVKPEQISSGKNNDIVDLKNAINLLVMYARAFAFKNDIWDTNTLERITKLKSKQVLTSENTADLLFAYNFLMSLRFRLQAKCIDNSDPMTNMLNTKDLPELELSILRKVLALLPAFQNKIAMDFRITG